MRAPATCAIHIQSRFLVDVGDLHARWEFSSGKVNIKFQEETRETFLRDNYVTDLLLKYSVPFACYFSH